MAVQPKPRIFGTLDDRARDSLVRALTGGDAVLSSRRRVSFHFFDTFDWRLHRRGLALVREDRVLRLRDRRTGEVVAEQRAAGEVVPPFVSDWDRGDLRDRLRGLVKVRALVHLVSLEGSARGLDHTDPKTGRTWRLEFHELWVMQGDRELGFPHVVALHPVDGRPRGGRRLAKLVRAAGLRQLPATLLEPALQVARVRPGAYTGKVRAAIDPDRPACESAVRLAEHLADTLTANLKGMRRDVDTEFLHDARVAMRRTRTLLSLFRTVFPKALRKEFRDRFRDLGAVTGPVRDLDVHLLRYAEYRTMVPRRHRAGLQELFAHFGRKRAVAHATLVDRMDAGDFDAVLRDWRKALAESAGWDVDPDRAGEPTGALAARVVAQTHLRLVEKGRAVGDDPVDEDLHRLRIAGKKFRYALEFFRPLADRNDFDDLLAVMKNLQDLLGEHNDLAVKGRELAALADEPEDHGLTEAALRAVRVFGKRLKARRAELKSEFAEVFGEFDTKKTARKVRRIFD